MTGVRTTREFLRSLPTHGKAHWGGPEGPVNPPNSSNTVVFYT